MPEASRLTPARLALIVGLCGLTLGVGLGSSGRLTYHEAFVAQAASELIARGAVLVPTIDGLPWLEKPPLAFWVVAISGKLAGGVTEWSARIPSALAATVLALGVAVFAARRFGSTVGLLSGLIQATTVWTIMRGRLAEADILLACLVTWTFVAFDRLRSPDPDRSPLPWRLAFFGLIGASSLVKGLGFGAVLIVSSVLAVLVWDRDRSTFKSLLNFKGWAMAGALAVTWPILAAIRHPQALSLWTMHVTDRMASHPEYFIGGPWWQYGPAVLLQALPWTPLALLGAWASGRRAFSSRDSSADRLLWVWAVVPILVLSTATVKNSHYAIHALPPWSVWAAMGLTRVACQLERRGWSAWRIQRATASLFLALGLIVGLGYWGLAPRLDRRGEEWASCQAIGRTLDPSLPLVFLYEDWDRKPYPTPFGPVPHDWAVRLYYLQRPATWRQGFDDLADHPPTPSPSAPYALLGRDRDLPGLRKLGRVEVISKGPAIRFDRTFTLFRVTPGGQTFEARR